MLVSFMSIPNFIRTTDKDTAEQLRVCGFYEVVDKTSEGVYLFVNTIDKKFDNSKIDYKKISYTNKLCI